MSKSNKSFPEGVVLLITKDGTVIEVLHDTFNIFPNESESGSSFIDYLKSDSVEKGCRFIESINNNGVAYNWELQVENKNFTSLFNCSGAKTEEWIILIGSHDPGNLEQFMNGLMKMNNEHINKLRMFMKKDQKDFSKKNEWSLYDDMSKLNNELANTQRELSKKTVELERTNEIKNQMIGMAAHDLRNPLMIIQNYAEFLIDDHIQEETVFTDDQYRLIKQINESSTYMIQIIEDMLDISSFDSGSIKLEKKSYNLVDLIEETASLSRPSANKKSINITTQLPDSSVFTEIDAHKLRQVLDNLLSNAVKYSNPNTEIEVGIIPVDQSEGVSFFVKDQGLGIPKDELDKLFKPYSRISVKATAGEPSTGLGLSIVKKIVEAHGGTIEVDSEVGVGSTFVVKLP